MVVTEQKTDHRRTSAITATHHRRPPMYVTGISLVNSVFRELEIKFASSLSRDNKLSCLGETA